MYKMQLRLLHFGLFFLILAGCKPPCHIALSSSSTMPSPPPLSFLSWNNPCSTSDCLPPIVICHGLLGQAKNFQTLGELLASSHPKRGVYALDMRNHGPHHNRWRSTMTYTEMAGDVVEWMDWCGLPKAVFIGHSMGGKVVMNLAASKGGRERVAGLIVLDIAPVEYRSNDGTSWELINGIIDACASLPLDEVASKKEAENWFKHPSRIPDINLRSFVMTNLEASPDSASPLRWRSNIGSIKSSLPEIASFDLPPSDGPPSYPGDTYFIAGGQSKYVRVQYVPAIEKLFPRHMLATIRGCGHWVHAENPADVLSLIGKYLEHLEAQ